MIYWYLGVYRGMEKTKDTIIIFGSGFVVVQLPVCRLSWSPIECNLVDRTVPIFFAIASYSPNSNCCNRS